MLIFFLRGVFTPRRYLDQFSSKSKDFIQLGHVDWLNKLIPTLDAFKEGNMVYIVDAQNDTVSAATR